MFRKIFILGLLGVISYSLFEIFGVEGNYQRFKSKLTPKQLEVSCTSIHQSLFKSDSNGTEAVWTEIAGGIFNWDIHVVRVRDTGKGGVMLEGTCIPQSSSEGFDLVVRFPQARKDEVFTLKPGQDVRVRGLIYKRMAGLIFADAN